MKFTQLHSYHETHAQMTEFAGYEMPLWYSTTSEEHLAVRNSSGIFDVSHMGRVSVSGSGATAFLEGIVPTNVASQPPGKAFYTLLLDDRGGIIDDLIIMRLAEDDYLMVVNAANSKSDQEHVAAQAPREGVVACDMTSDSAMVAVQGPGAQRSLQRLTDVDLSQLKRFRCTRAMVLGVESLISRTGYTGEDGFEVILHGQTADHPDGALRVWEELSKSSVPCGLGARDSLRLEAGFPLHGSDIDRTTNPYEADLAWVLSAGKEGYIGSKSVKEAGASHPPSVRRGVVLERGIPRHGFEVLGSSGRVGDVTSGTFSPLLRQGIAQCRVDFSSSEYGTKVSVVVRDAPSPGAVTKPPFYDEQLYGWKRRSNGK
ncbi:MAG TPA: glycine cleavage system aminomethyltransferase GcvT [Nitrososphaerales archaeon]|nr:glycine cleavage system aminomethyltransferase GcvT [Nitrososphaerales archaeon]